jgi:copper chaperone CopZ
MMRITMTIEGMTCAGCVRSVEKALAAVDGLRAVAVDLAIGKAVIEAIPGSDPKRFLAAVEDAGYDAVLDG